MKALLSLFARGVHVPYADKTLDLQIGKSDSANNKFIECPVALKADAVVTGDKAAATIDNYMGNPVIHPRGFLDLFNKSGR